MSNPATGAERPKPTTPIVTDARGVMARIGDRVSIHTGTTLEQHGYIHVIKTGKVKVLELEFPDIAEASEWMEWVNDGEFTVLTKDDTSTRPLFPAAGGAR